MTVTVTIGHNTLHSIAIQYPILQCLLVTIHLCIAIQSLPSLLLLQYKFQPTALSIAIQCNPCNTIFPQATIQNLTTTHPRLQYNLLYCNTTSSPQSFFSAIQYSVLHYNFLYFKPKSLQYDPLSCNTKYLLLEPATFQPPRLQYKPCLAIQKISFHNITWAVAQNGFCTNFFFLILIIIFFIYFQQLEKSLEITKNHFFSIFFNTQINLQKFIFFIFLQFYTI